MYGSSYYGEEGEEDEEDEDYEEGDDDEEEEEEDDRGDYEPDFNSSNMSPDLLRALGLAEKIDNSVKCDWVPPSTAGLVNSDPILDLKNRQQQAMLQSDNKTEMKTTGSIMADTVRAGAKLGNYSHSSHGMDFKPAYEADAKDIPHQSPDKIHIEDIEADGPDESSEEEIVDPEVESFYDDLVQGKRDLKGDDAYWQMRAHLNASLNRLFGKITEVDNSNINWERPKTYGLRNSEPIIKTKHNQYKEEQEVRNIYQADHKVTDSAALKMDLFKTTQNTQQVSSGYLAQRQEENRGMIGFVNFGQSNEEDEEDEDYYEDEEDEEDYYYEEENSGNNNLITTAMSPNLLKIFGISVESKNQLNDWIPPSKNGLDYSDPLLRKEDMIKLSNGLVAKRKEVVF